MKLGSLFDGSGGFPLAGSMCGIEPIFASEVEPYPIAVTTSRFPNMKHYGDVTKINGAELEPVDVLTFGSPCQGLSAAGLQKGLADDRSGLLMEAIRIIKEMREATNGVYPRFAVWENVFGAFSSNKGEDFKTVLEEFVKVVEPSAEMPPMPKGGWAYADVIVGDGWSVAYRTYDAQYWGVPQRRRRIYLVADFGGECAAEISFKREGLRGYFEKGNTPWQGSSAAAQNGIATDDSNGTRAGFCNGVVIGTVTTPSGGMNEHIPCVMIENHPADSRVNIDESGKCQTLTSRMGTGGGNVPMVMEPFCKSSRPKSADDVTTWVPGRIANTLNTFDVGEVRANELVVETVSTTTHGGEPAVVYAVDQGGGKSACNVTEENSPTLTCTHGGAPAVAYGFYPQMKAESMVWTEEKAGCLVNGTNPGFHNGVCITEPEYIVRRLTPTECARLQGFPDKWGHPDKKTELTDEEYKFWFDVRKTDAEINGKQVKEWTKPQILAWYNKLHTDSSEYKMWGNGIALPNALYVMQGISEVLKRSKNNGGKQ